MKAKKDFLILVADDVRSMRKLLVKILHLNGFLNTKEASNGAQAIKYCQQEDFDLVLVDWHMPEISGIDVLKSLRATPKSADIPFIMISSEATEIAVETALEMGANTYIDKPFEREEIIERVKALLHIIEE